VRPRSWLAIAAAIATWLSAMAASRDGDAQPLPAGGVDLHSHLSMKPALGPLFRGEIDAPLQADSWRDRLSSNVNGEALDASGLSVVVAALFSHAVLGGDMRDQVREQIAEIQAFVRTHPRWAIVRDAAEARAHLAAGGRVIVLSLEGASGVLESEEDLVEFVDRLGIRMVTPLHLVDDRYGGAATMHGFQYLSNPLGVAARLLEIHEGIEKNPRGLAPLGRRLVAELLARGVWIDFTHASDAAVREILPMVRAAGQPVLITHAVLRRHRPAERSTSDEMLQAVQASGGIVGLLPSEDAFESPPDRLCLPGCTAEACEHGVNGFAAVWADAARRVGADAVMLGGDYNGGVRHLAPSCGTGTSLDGPRGLWSIAQSGDLLVALSRLGAPRAPLASTLERFLGTWARVQPRRIVVDGPMLPSREAAEGPSWTGHAALGVAGGDAPTGALLQAELRLRKDTGIPLDAEPIVYVTRLGAEAVETADGSTPYFRVTFAPAGIVASSGYDLVEAEALPFSLARRVALDQALAARVELVRGRVRTTPRALSTERGHAVYVELDLDLLGYQWWRHASTRADLHGVVLAGGRLELGSAMRAEDPLGLSIYFAGSGDITLLPDAPGGVGYLSQLLAAAGLRAAQLEGKVFEGLEMQLLGVREGHADPRWLTTHHYRALVGLGF
jgi:membrane dipeptidase